MVFVTIFAGDTLHVFVFGAVRNGLDTLVAHENFVAWTFLDATSFVKVVTFLTHFAKFAVDAIGTI